MNRSATKWALLSSASFLVCAGLYVIPFGSDVANVHNAEHRYPGKLLKYAGRIPSANESTVVEAAPIIAQPETPALESREPISGGAIRRRQRYISIIRREAKSNDLPVEVADAVAYVESRYDETSIGGVGEIGLMQVLPSTAAMMGFRGTELELAQPEVNIHYGVSYLAQAWRLAGGDLCRALMKYRAGHGEERMTPKSVAYCQAARIYLAQAGQNGAALAMAPAPAADPELSAAEFFPTGNRFKATPHISRDPATFWAAHESRIKMLKQRVYAKWRHIAQAHLGRTARVFTASNDGR